MASNKKPPFRADHVGSLLRPADLLEARAKWHDGGLPAEDLKALEDKYVAEIVARQEEIGLKSITDGEFRRDYWHLDFLAGFEGIEISGDTFGHRFSSGLTVATTRVTAPVGPHSGNMRGHFTYIAGITQETPKFTIPGPGMTYLRSGRDGISEDVYPDLDEYWEDLTAAYAGEVQALYDAGCRYLQIDDVSFAYLCDEDFRKGVYARGDDPDDMLVTFAKALSGAVKDRPADMTVATHMCRGNFQSTWMTSGGYATVAEQLFATLDVDAYFMEFDDERSGDFEPLKFVDGDKTVVAGIVTTKLAGLEKKDDIKRRIDEAAKYLPLERLCLSPQCGFSSTHHGNKLDTDQQWRKLALVVETAEEVWGTA